MTAAGEHHLPTADCSINVLVKTIVGSPMFHMDLISGKTILVTHISINQSALDLFCRQYHLLLSRIFPRSHFRLDPFCESMYIFHKLQPESGLKYMTTAYRQER